MSFKLSSEPWNDFFEYNGSFKRFMGLFLIGIFVIIGIVVGVYFGFLKDLSLFQGTVVVDFLAHMGSEVKNFSFLGFLYIYMFGGLIFLFIPLEPYFIGAVGAGKFHLINVFAMFLGLLIAYSINYLVGWRFSKLSIFLVPTKKFYSVKSFVNRYGVFAILFSTLIFGAQQAMFVLGVFRYNKLRLFIFTFVGTFVKYVFLGLLLSGLVKIPFVANLFLKFFG